MIDTLVGFMLFAQESLGGGGAAPTGAPAAGGGAAPGGGAGGGMGSLVIIGVMFVVFYFVLIRPQSKKAKAHRQMVAALKRGDSVITNGGIRGRIMEIDGQWVTVEIDKKSKTRIQILKTFVGGIADETTEQELSQQPR